MSHTLTSCGATSGQRKTPRTGDRRQDELRTDTQHPELTDSSADGRRLTQHVRDNHPGNVASEHGEERAQAADQQAELERQRRGYRRPSGGPCPADTFTFPGFCCLKADASSRRSLRESPGGGAGPDGLARPESMSSQLRRGRSRETGVKCPRGDTCCGSAWRSAPGGGRQHSGAGP